MIAPTPRCALRPAYTPVGLLPSWATMEQVLRAWHEQSLRDPEYQWLDLSFEAMADSVNKAVFCAAAPRDQKPDDSWKARQNGVL